MYYDMWLRRDISNIFIHFKTCIQNLQILREIQWIIKCVLLSKFHVKSTLVTKYNMLLLFKLLFFCNLSVIIFGVTGIPFSPSSGLNSRDFILSSLLFRQDKISLEDNQEKILVSSARVYNLSNLFLLTIFVVKLRLLIEA